MPFLLFLLIWRLGKKGQGRVWMPMELSKGKECSPTLAVRKYLATPSQLKTKSTIECRKIYREKYFSFLFFDEYV